MAEKISGKYLGDLKVELTHESSGTIIRTSAPRDNNGDGSSFSPSDLVAAATGACIVTILGIIAQKKKIDISGTYFTAEKHMSTEPRRIGYLPITVHLPKHIVESERKRLEEYALSCPVHHSLHPNIESPVTFLYDV